MPNRSGAATRKKVWPYFLPLFYPFWLPLSLAGFAMALDALLTAFRPWPLKVVIDRVLSHKPSHVPFFGGWLDHLTMPKVDILYGACAATLIIAVSTGVSTYLFTRLLGQVGQRFVFALRRNLFAHMQRLSLRFHDHQRTGDLITRLTSDIQSLQDMIANGMLVLGSNTFLLAGMITLMFWLNWHFAIAALSVAPLLFWAIVRYTVRIKSAARQAQTSTGILASVAQETFSSIRIVQGLAQEEQQDERFAIQSATNQAAFQESIRYQARIAPVVDVLAAVGLALVMWYGATSVLSGSLTTGDVIVFFAYVTNLYSPMRALARLSYTSNKAVVAAERIVEVMAEQSEVRDRPNAHAISTLRGAIGFQDVSFEYKKHQAVLSEIRLEIQATETVALVGSTGAGKSTLASLVPRFYDPTTGRVCIDGTDVKNYRLQSLREHISLVLQDSWLFSGSIRENIAFGYPGASDRQVAAAAKLAHAEEFIQRMPAGYDTIVAENGVSLSGGQKQRIAIARAILRDAPILILDEPTSGLDAASEATVIDALRRAAAGRTTLIIAHRLTSVRFADRIIVLKHGSIAEQGSHDELLRCNGTYANYHNLQTAVGATPLI